MAPDLYLQIVTPFGRTYQNDVKTCTVPGFSGQFQVLKNHATMLSLVEIGMIKIEELGGSMKYLATSGGFFEVNNNQIQIIAETAEFAGDIDEMRVIESLKRARERLADQTGKIDFLRAKVSLMRAVNRMNVVKFK
jgi:F-type H+-transporting ATPase subunit epsilon